MASVFPTNASHPRRLHLMAYLAVFLVVVDSVRGSLNLQDLVDFDALDCDDSMETRTIRLASICSCVYCHSTNP